MPCSFCSACFPGIAVSLLLRLSGFLVRRFSPLPFHRFRPYYPRSYLSLFFARFPTARKRLTHGSPKNVKRGTRNREKEDDSRQPPFCGCCRAGECERKRPADFHETIHRYQCGISLCGTIPHSMVAVLPLPFDRRSTSPFVRRYGSVH